MQHGSYYADSFSKLFPLSNKTVVEEGPKLCGGISYPFSKWLNITIQKPLKW